MRKWEHHWYQSSRTFLSILLLPFSWLFQLLVHVRYFFYRIGLKKTVHFSVPVIVVGILLWGGTGKTPFVIWLARYLRQHGLQPGIVTRGVGGKKQVIPVEVTSVSLPAEVGDEALLLKAAGCPVAIGLIVLLRLICY